MQHEMIASAFYKYIRVENALEFQKQHLEFCKSIGLLGRILVGNEGINGVVYGTSSQIKLYQNELRSNPLFSDIDFKDQKSSKPAFRKMFVRIRNEIVHFGQEVDIKNTGEFVSPSLLKDMLDRNEDIVLVDMRNDYEARIGKFKNARIVPMRNFRDLPMFMDLLSDLKDKKIVTYCTGGIRCEKASAYLKENGFSNVLQLQGGILKYGMEYPDTYFEGKCFVFDDRLAVSINTKDDAITKCQWCKKECGDYVNCHNLDCDKLFVCCEDCGEPHRKSCCEECEIAPRRRKELIAFSQHS